MPARMNRPDKFGFVKVQHLGAHVAAPWPADAMKVTVGHVHGGGSHTFSHVIWVDRGRIDMDWTDGDWDYGAVFCAKCGAWRYTTPHFTNAESANRVRTDAVRIADAYGTSCSAVAAYLTVVEVQGS